VKDRLQVLLVCLVFAVPFGGIGAFAAWMIGTMVHDGQRAQEWVKVRATVTAPKEYVYVFNGREYHGARLGLDPIDSTDNIDDWHDAMASHMSAAMAEKKPITVFVNPEAPAESVVDREVRWKLVLFLSIFALVFGGVGVGALFAGVRALFGKKAVEASQRGRRAQANQQAGVGFLWIFAFFWNAMSFPIAILVVPDAWREGEYAALLVLLFPLIGVLILWGAIAATISAIRRRLTGNAKPAFKKPAAAAPPPAARSDGFARGMLDDPRPAVQSAAAIDTLDDGLPRQPQ
jgi:hypothetical protein